MATTTLPIGTGETHTTIQSWESTTQIDLVAGEVIHVGEMKNEAFSGKVNYGGATSNASYYRRLCAKSGAEFDLTDRSGARLVEDSAETTLMVIKEDYLKLGLSEDGTQTGAIGISLTSSSAGNCVVGADSVTTMRLYNVIAYDSSGTTMMGFVGDSDQTDIKAYNCIVCNLEGTTSTTGDAYGYRGYNFDIVYYNCIAYKVYADDRASGFDAAECYNCAAANITQAVGQLFTFDGDCTGDYNAGDDANAPGANSVDNITDSDCWDDVAAGQEDFHIKSGCDLVDAGNDAYSVEWDMDGAIAGARDDIGCDEYAAAEGRVTHNTRSHPLGMGWGRSQLWRTTG